MRNVLRYGFVLPGLVLDHQHRGSDRRADRRRALSSGVGNGGARLVVGITIVLGLAVTAHRVHAACGDYLTEWGTAGSADGQFQNPARVAIDSAGHVYVADENNHRIQKFDANGTFLLKWGSNGSGDGQFASPFGITAVVSGFVFVADMFNHRIQKFDSSGNFIAKWGSLGSGNGQLDVPRSVAVDGSGNVYVAEEGNHRIQKFDSSGAYVLKWGSFGMGDGQFNRPYGVTIDASGSVYVADKDNHRIQKFDSDGNFLLKWGTNGGADGQFDTPVDVSIDSAGNVLVADLFNTRIQKFTPSGAFLAKWGTAGTGNGQFSSPLGITANGLDEVYAVDWALARVQKFVCTNCGNGVSGPDEQCDDGNLTAGDGCSDSCAIEACYVCNGAPSVCTQPDADGDSLSDLCDSCPSDSTNTCNPAQSTSGTIGSGGGGVTTGDGSVGVIVPPGALSQNTPISITGGSADSNFGVDRHGRDALLVDIGPSGTTFNAPVTITFSWPDADDDGKVDGFTSPILRESKLEVWKDGVAITQTNPLDPASAWCGDASHKAPACDAACAGLKCCCDEDANTWTVQITSLSELFVGQAFERLGVQPLKLVVVDKIALAGTAKTVFVAKDAGVTIGSGTDVGDISVRLDLAYAGGEAVGSFLVDAGASDGTEGWLVNKPTVAKFVNKAAPQGGTQGKVAVVKPGNLLKLAGRGLGDVPFDILGAGAPPASVYAAYCVANGGTEYCHCAEFTSCSYKPIAADTGAKLACKDGVPDPTCVATAP
jgi:cysteine-rich repeat protein